MPTPNAFSRITWPKKPVLSDPVQLARNKKFLELLCSLGEITLWNEFGTEGEDDYSDFPHRFLIEELEILFLPHWKSYVVKGPNIALEVPDSQEAFQEAIQAIKTLKRLGLQDHR